VSALKISEIKPGMRNLEVSGRITSVGEVRTVETRFGRARVAQALLEDDSGRIILNLWRDQVDAVRAGDLVRVENAFTRTFRERIELNVGRDGRIVVIRRTGR
jgi:replication factor A1